MSKQIPLTNISNNSSLFISTVYCPAGQPSIEFFNKLCQNKGKHILCGDFNSKHTASGDATNSQSGQLLLNIISENNLIITNDEIPTYFCESSQTESILDHI